MRDTINKRGISFTVVTIIYVLATLVGIFVYRLLDYPLWLNLLIADVVATIFTFIFSVILKNASVYDPYWSVQPIIIVTIYALLAEHVVFAGILVITAIWIWGVRLTGNWVYTFHGLDHQDWRYTMLSETTGSLYPIVNFTGIHMVPTLIVYGCTLPAVYIVIGGYETNIFNIIGFAICILSVLLQFTSDIQMHGFRKKKTGGLINVGLWKYARHPNYLAEICMWWGVAIQAVSVMPDRPWLFAGAFSNTVLFLVVSIPMADKRQSKKPGFDEYKARTHALIPIPKRG